MHKKFNEIKFKEIIKQMKCRLKQDALVLISGW